MGLFHISIPAVLDEDYPCELSATGVHRLWYLLDVRELHALGLDKRKSGSLRVKPCGRCSFGN